MTNIPKPAYRHDCEACQYIGQTIGGGKLVDLYAHRSTRLGDISRDASLIARYGDDGPEYWSAVSQMISADTCHAELLVAKVIWENLIRTIENRSPCDPIFNKTNADKSLPAPPDQNPAVKEAGIAGGVADPPTRRGAARTLY